MDREKIVHILSTLSSGVDPIRGEALPADNPCQHPDVVRALFHALRHLEGQAATPETAPSTEPSTAPEPAPASAERSRKARSRAETSNAGKPWSADEDARLASGFDAGEDPAGRALALGRSRVAVQVRLAKLGRLPMPEKTRYTTAVSAPAPVGVILPGAESLPKAEQPTGRYGALAADALQRPCSMMRYGALAA